MKRKKNKEKSNKKILIIIACALAIIAVAIILVFILCKKEKPGTDNKDKLSHDEVVRRINNTINLDSYEIDEYNELVGYDKRLMATYLVDKKNELGEIRHELKDDKYSINKVRIVENNKFSFSKHQDNYFYYYDGCGIGIGSSPNIDVYINEVLEIFKKLDFSYKDGEYYHKVEGSGLEQILKDNFPMADDYTGYVGLVFNDEYIESFKILYYADSYGFNGEDDSIDISTIYHYTFSKYNSVNTSIPNNIKTSLAHNYYGMLSYEDNNEALRINNNNYFDSKELCSNGKSKTTFEIRSYNGFFYTNIVKQDCDSEEYYTGQTYEKEILQKLFIKNTTDKFLINDDHSKDTYIMYDYNSSEEVGRFKYDKEKNTISVNSGKYKGTYTLRSK